MRGIHVEDPLRRTVALRVEVGDGVLLLENAQQRVDVQVAQSSLGRQRRHGMADVEVIFDEPHIGLHAGTTSLQGREQRHGAPVVIVRVASHGDDISGDVRWPMQDVRGWGSLVAMTPPLDGTVEFVGEEGDGDAAGDGDELDDAPKSLEVS